MQIVKLILNEIRSEVNQAKGDLSTSELFDNPNSKGQYAREVHNISSKEEKQLREKDKEARTEYDRVRDEAEKRANKIRVKNHVVMKRLKNFRKSFESSAFTVIIRIFARIDF